ncbi:MAG TPA: glycosyltransferase family 2 protein, partial [Acetobacteraceae bacterium]
MYPIGDHHSYMRWVREHDTRSAADQQAIRRMIAGSMPMTLLSIVIPAALPGPNFAVGRAFASLLGQLYPHWEALVPDTLLESNDDGRVVTLCNCQDDAASIYNSAMERASGEFVLILPPDAVLPEHALFECANAVAANPNLDLIFTDEDQIDAGGNRFGPRFKTDWDPDLMLGRDGVGMITAIRTETVRRLGGMQAGMGIDLGQYGLVLRVGAATTPRRIHHIPAVLCHRQMSDSAGIWDSERARAVVRQHLANTGVAGARVEAAPLAPAWNRVVRPIPAPAPLVTVIVPTRDGADILARCAEGVLSRTEYAPLELLIVDNDSCQPETHELLRRLKYDDRVRVLRYPGPFNYSAINNAAVEAARGEVIVLLNNDTVVMHPCWLTEMVSHAIRPEIGAVGAKLLYGDGRVQHCGVTLGRGPALIHQLRLADRLDPGLNGALALVRSVSAVTAACLALRKSVFLEVGGLDAVNLKTAFNDVDLCLRIGDHGYRVICTP